MVGFFRIFFILLALLTPGSLFAEKDSATEAAPDRKTLYRDLELFSKVLHLVNQEYVEEVKDQDLIYGAIRGMLGSLDPHSVFMTPENYRELRVDTEGKFGGVGLEITVKDNMLTVVTPIEGSPAAKAGIREGDRILRINGLSTKEMTLTEAVRRMRGSRGARVHLHMIREGSREPFDVTLTRDIIRIKSVRHEIPEQGFGYVRITSFQENTADELERALSSLSKNQGGPLKGLILDLRNNPGGLLDEAIEIADLFLGEGAIVSTVSRDQELDKKLASRQGNEPVYPIIVLVNGGSASAAEIVAGALQDHQRAVILGTQTFGKGSVQTIYELGDGAALKLTVAKYYTPKGRSIQAEGIQPDIIVDARKISESVVTRERFVREKDLKGHLESVKKEKGAAKESEEEDYQKKVALDYLKSWDVFHKK